MRFLFTLTCITLLLSVSCKTKKYASNSTRKYKIEKPSPAKINNIISTAYSFLGTPYKYGGTSKKGMDCSGLIYTCFQKNKIQIPRTTSGLAKRGKKISKNKIKKGDLLFFNTRKRKSKRKITHIGLVVNSKNNNIKFIHASSSKGVIISSLNENFWKKSFIKAIRFM